MHSSKASFGKNDGVFVKKLPSDAKIRSVFEAFGIFEGVSLSIFYEDKTKIIFKIGETKLALSKKITQNLFAL